MGSRANGEGRPNGLMDYLEFYEMLPIPNACDSNNANMKEGHDLKKGYLRGIVLEMTQDVLLPTPRANKIDDLNLDNPNIANRNKSNLEEEVAKVVQAKKRVSDDGTPSRLSPLFTEEMMGFPLMWTALPFLSENGEQKA